MTQTQGHPDTSLKTFAAEVPKRVESPLLHYRRVLIPCQSLAWHQGVEPGDILLQGCLSLAQAILVRVQHHSKPRFGWVMVQEKKSKRLCLCGDVATHTVQGTAWDPGVVFWGTCL